jgi:hypothetical protein
MKVVGIVLLALSMLSFIYYGVSERDAPTQDQQQSTSPLTQRDEPVKPTWALVMGGFLFGGAALMLLLASKRDVARKNP